MANLGRSSEHGSSSTKYHTIPPPKPIRRLVSCPVSTSSGLPAGSSRRRISFAAEVQVQEVVCRNDMTDEEFDEIWYNKDDFRAMKKRYIPTLKKMAKGIPLDDTDDEARGLEHKTPKGSHRRKSNRYSSLEAVLQEQDRQWERNRIDADFIAEIYVQATAHCRLQASLTAQSDAEYVAIHVSNGEAAKDQGEGQNEEPIVTIVTERESIPVSPLPESKICQMSGRLPSPRVLSAAA